MLLFGDNAGARPELRQLARDLASHGLFVALADPWASSGERFEPPLGPAERRRIQPLREGFLVSRMADYARAATDAMTAHPGSLGTRIGLIGLCIGSGFVLAALEALGGRAFAASILDGCELGDRLGGHPARLPECPLQLVTPAALSGFADELAKHVEQWGGGPIQRRDLAGVSHGFCFRSWPGDVYAAGDAERELASAADFLREAHSRAPASQGRPG